METPPELLGLSSARRTVKGVSERGSQGTDNKGYLVRGQCKPQGEQIKVSFYYY